MGIPAHMARSRKGTGMTYATSPQSADHTAGTVSDEPLSPDGQAERSRKAQIDMAAFDCLGMCWFTFIVDKYEIFTSLINNLYGVNWDSERYLQMGKEVISMELAFNRNAGFSHEKDQIPRWLKDEQLPPLNSSFNVPEEDYQKVWKDF
jgi:aldehyde:ferredoxin oxidoreductase